MPVNARPGRPFPTQGPALHRVVEEWVGDPLMPDGRAGAMAADKTDVIAERQQLFGDGTDQGRMAAAGQIGAADRAVEQHVADMGEAHLLVEKHHAARRMTWAVENVKRQLTDADLFAFA